MKAKWVEKEIKYDGSQLASLHNYLMHGLSGDSVVAWIGPCDIAFEKMADGEDLLQNAEIRGGKMLHFLVEKFDVSLFGAVAFQRLITSLAFEKVIDRARDKFSSDSIRRDGDDIYIAGKKLSISVAVPSFRSCLIHFALNITNENTPVPTVSLEDLGLKPEPFAKEMLAAIVSEAESIVFATHKVHGVGDFS